MLNDSRPTSISAYTSGCKHKADELGSNKPQVERWASDIKIGTIGPYTSLL